ncbi:MAG: DUF2911 domain-containing protein [Flavobacteriaceae bacterium]|uniref:DUF2911 domain-containing protein n=1 Tax=Flagellimonas sp. SN16 TaxID=3415142 RepID=UPI003C6201C6|nr:DUF2911 domain-containing protein [Flavobacteriaceae bacterium]
MIRLFVCALLLSAPLGAFAQFHTLKIPQTSNRVTETQQLAVTDITISYSSPSVNGRDVWNNPNIIPQKEQPIAWRAGANMNTTISFSTDVLIEGQSLKAGTYGYHIVPDGNDFELLFAHNHNQWGSYYLDRENDVTLAVNVNGEACEFSEKLDYEFLDWTPNSVTIGLEWADKRVPFKVSVDLETTVVESFRSELRGINTYHWQAWNDAARWCLDHNTNLDEALQWANRSINGGFNGFAADNNLTNMSTKALLLEQLGRSDEVSAVLDEVSGMVDNAMEANSTSMLMLRLDQPKKALDFVTSKIKEYPEAWFLKINKGVSHYFLNDPKRAIKELESVLPETPQQFQPRVQEIIDEVQSGTYRLPF